MKTIIEFAEEKDCSRQTVYSAIRRGEVEPIKKYGKWLIKSNVKNAKWQPDESKKRFKAK